MKLAVGTKLGRYEIRSIIGVGGMGELFQTEFPAILRLIDMTSRLTASGSG